MNILPYYLSGIPTKIQRFVHHWQYLFVLHRIIRNTTFPKSLKKLFGRMSDEFWFWLYTDGYRQSPVVRQLLPAMPDESLQLQFTGISGDTTLQQAFAAYRLFKTIGQQYGKTLDEKTPILDFGCGWGRIIRFFLKDVEPANLYGVDCDSVIIELCITLNLQAHFQIIHPSPPTDFSDNMFDLIYAYSVFSHLSEDIHTQWLMEFKRILKPGGIFIATTRPKEFIFLCAQWRQMRELPVYLRGSAASFIDAGQVLEEYNAGKYCFSYTGGDGSRDGSFYGETCIPRQYVERNWSQYFSEVDFIEHQEHQQFDQNVMIAQK